MSANLCVWCLLPFGLKNADGEIVEPSADSAAGCVSCMDDIRCRGCTQEYSATVVGSDWDHALCKACAPCDYECGCESELAHDEAEAESMADFLRNPGPPPAHFTDEQIERCERGMAAARAKGGL